MNRITHIVNPTETRSRFGVLRTFIAVSLIAAGGLSTLAFTSSTIADESRADKTEQRSENSERDTMQFNDAVLRITSALVEGKLSSAVAAEYISAALQRIDAAESYAAFKAQILASCKAGELAREDILPELNAYKKALGAQLESDTTARIDAALKRGRMSAQESREVLSTYAKQDGQSGKGITRKDYAQAQAKLKWMVAEGEITEQQMTEKLGEMRLMIGKQGITREDYAQAQAKMTEMVAAGEVTQEKMAKVLGAMRKMIGNSAKRATRAAYAEAQDSMQKMVDAGKITQEQMDARLVEMRKMIGRGRGDARRSGQRANGGDGEGRSDECLALRRKLGAAVTNGEMTREEAGEVWRAEGCGS